MRNIKSIGYMLILFISLFAFNKISAYKSYSVGDEVTYNNVDYYVIADSGVNEEEVQLLKKDPLTVAQVNQYGAGHVNMYVTSDTSASYYQQAYNINYNGTDTGIGGMAYYSSATCGYNGSEWVDSGCTTDYAQSEVKYVVDAWKTAQAPAASDARLITLEDLKSLGYSDSCIQSGYCSKSAEAPSWLHINSWYWTSSPSNSSSSFAWDVFYGGVLGSDRISNYHGVVRPVITISKSLISSTGN